jgi:pimeloyl-ACP methyl ester carboxylesterase
VGETATHILDMRSEFDPQLSAFANILLPSLVICGERSTQSLRRTAEILRDGLANASLSSIPEAGHFMVATHAPELAERIGDHVSKAEALAWSSLCVASPFGLQSRDPAA